MTKKMKKLTVDEFQNHVLNLAKEFHSADSWDEGAEVLVDLYYNLHTVLAQASLGLSGDDMESLLRQQGFTEEGSFREGISA